MAISKSQIELEIKTRCNIAVDATPTVTQIRDAFADEARMYLAKRLNVKPNDIIVIPDDELFNYGGLNRKALRQQIFNEIKRAEEDGKVKPDFNSLIASDNYTVERMGSEVYCVTAKRLEVKDG